MAVNMYCKHQRVMPDKDRWDNNWEKTFGKKPSITKAEKAMEEKKLNENRGNN
tara:strand:- start:2807 stop:2965 length:159 start_codon:yes stop_codon:yes gene_type:complete